MFGSRIWNCMVLSVGNGGCEQSAEAFQKQIDTVRDPRIHAHIHTSSTHPHIHPSTHPHVQKVLRWCDAPWTLKRSQGSIFGEQACENDPDACPIFCRVVTEATRWEV